jgi:hypothetical protein
MICCSVIDTRLMTYVIVEFLSQLPIIDKKGYIEYGILHNFKEWIIVI